MFNCGACGRSGDFDWLWGHVHHWSETPFEFRAYHQDDNYYHPIKEVISI